MAAPRFFGLVAGKIKQIVAAVTSTADSIVATDGTGKIDVSFLPTGIGAEVITATASEALSAGDFVNIYNLTGALAVRKADATTNGKPAYGFVLASVSNGALATIYLPSQNNTSLTSLTIGSDYFLSTTPGAATTTPPSTAGNIVQFLGRAHSTTAMVFVESPTIEIA